MLIPDFAPTVGGRSLPTTKLTDGQEPLTSGVKEHPSSMGVSPRTEVEGRALGHTGVPEALLQSVSSDTARLASTSASCLPPFPLTPTEHCPVPASVFS